MRARHRRTRVEERLVLAAVMMLASSCAARGAPGELPGFIVEAPAVLQSGQPAPTYPAELVPTGDTGTVRIRVAIEPTGRIDPASVEVLQSPHPAFTRAVLAVLPHYQFLPAETGGGPPKDCRTNPGRPPTCRSGRPGTKVRSLVVIPFVFAPPPAAGPTPVAPLHNALNVRRS
jgi:TonB family protein